MTFGDGSVWVTNAGDRSVSAIDPATGNVRATLASGADGRGVAFGTGSLWVIDQSTDTVVQIDPRSHDVVRTIHVGSGPAAIVSAFGSIWVANSFDGTVSRIDPRTGVVAGTVDVGGSPISVAATAKLLWVADETNHRLVAIDPATGTVARRVDVGVPPVAIAAAPTKLWVSAQSAPGPHRGGTLMLDAPLGDIDSVDPAIAYSAGAGWLSMTNDGLVGFRHASGSDGTQIVPISPSDPGTSGRRHQLDVRAQARDPLLHRSRRSAGGLSDALERVFRLGSPGVAFYAGLVGGAACEAHPSRCDLRKGVVTDAASRTVTFHLIKADPDFLDKLALPFADAVPCKGNCPRRIVPASRDGSVHAHRLRSAPRPEARSQSVLQALVVRGAAQRVGPDSLERGAGGRHLYDRCRARPRRRHVRESPGEASGRDRDTVRKPAALAPVRRRALHLHEHARAAVRRPARPPCPELRARSRRDRRLHGGRRSAEPTCQYIPPLLPGHIPYCPYTRDLVTAQKLIAASGTHGMPVVVWSPKAQPYQSEMRYVMSVLRGLGYRASITFPGDTTPYARVNDSRSRAQVGEYSWIADYPTPSDFINRQFRCSAFHPASPLNYNVAGFAIPRPTH